MIFMRDGAARHPIRRTCAQILVEEDGRSPTLDLCHTIRPPFAGRRTITEVRQHGRANLRVIRQDIGFSGLGLGIEHLVQVAELDRAALNGDHLVMRSLGHRVSIDAAIWTPKYTCRFRQHEWGSRRIMRAIWKGAITFGLVNVPIKLYPATEDHDISLHQVHDADGGRIRYERRCEVCGKVVEYAHIDKAYAEGKTTVVLTDEDLKSLPEERSHEIEVVEFVPSEQIDEIMLDRSYFLEPDKAAAKPYALLRRALEETDRTAIAQFSLRQKTRLGALRSRGKVLMLQSLLWDDEVREADFPSLKEDVRVSPQELKMAMSLVDNMATDFNPEKFSDEYQDQLRQLIAAKLEKGDALDTAATFGEQEEAQADRGEVVDLLEALRRSVEENRAARKGTEAKSAAKKAPAKKAPAKKTSTGKTAAKKSPAKKTPAKKAPAKKAGAKKTSAGRSAKKAS